MLLLPFVDNYRLDWAKGKVFLCDVCAKVSYGSVLLLLLAHAINAVDSCAVSRLLSRHKWFGFLTHIYI